MVAERSNKFLVRIGKTEHDEVGDSVIGAVRDQAGIQPHSALDFQSASSRKKTRLYFMFSAGSRAIGCGASDAEFSTCVSKETFLKVCPAGKNEPKNC